MKQAKLMDTTVAVENAPETALTVSDGMNLQRALELAAQAGGVDTIERLHAVLKDERNHRAIGAFIEARNRVRMALGPIRKNRSRPIAGGAKSAYADLPQIESALRQAGAYREGFSWHWDTDADFSVCVLSHVGGHSITSRIPIQGDKRDNRATSEMDKIKAATFQADRASLIRVWGIGDMTDSAGEDMPPEYNREYERLNDEQQLTLEARLHEAADAKGKPYIEILGAMLAWAGVREFSDFPASKYDEALNKIGGWING